MYNFFKKIFKTNKKLTLKDSSFLKIYKSTEISKLFDSISNFNDTSEIRYVGGCVRKILNQEDVDDIDLAVNLNPNQVKECLQSNNIKFFETGIKHGTITANIGQKNFEITSLREDVDTFYELLNDRVWDCSQCFSCTRCPRQNNPGGIITIMREVAVNHGLQSAKDALQAYSRIIYKIMSTGTQVAPDMLQPDFFPDWGPDVKQVSDNLDVWRRCVPPETMHTTELAWDVSEKTRLELYMIWKLTGNLEMIEKIDEGIYMILEEVMEELLEENGYDIDDFENLLDEDEDDE